MVQKSVRPKFAFSALASVVGVVAIALLIIRMDGEFRNRADFQLNHLRETGTPQLVSVEPIPQEEGPLCEWSPATASSTLTQALAEERPAGGTVDVDRAPVRTIRDPNPAFSAIAVEPVSNRVVVTDENLFQVLEYDRRENTPASARMTEPKRVVGGTKTKAEMMCGVYIDPKTLDTYILNNDTQNFVSIFSKDARGNVEPDRYLIPPGGHTFGIAMDEERQEMFLTIQAVNAVVVYRKMATGKEAPLRNLFGEDTHLEDPHGVAVDSKRKLLFVSNHGSVAQHAPSTGRGGGGKEIRGSGKFDPPSITVYPLDANGNVRPLRIIEGPKARLNWPGQIAVDEEAGELYIANDMDHSIVVFGEDEQGDVAPRRVLRGPKTGIRNPTGVALDLKNHEMWIANMGNHSATMFPMTANGDVPPTRVIRGGPSDELSLMIGNPGGVGYDTKREQVLVPN